MTLPRRHMLTASLGLAPLVLAACAGGDAQPPLQPAPGYGFLTPLRLNVLEVEVLEPPPALNFRIDPPAPLSPLAQALRMGRERLSAVGTTGRARFMVDNATLTRELAQPGGLFSQRTERLTAVIRVRVEVLDNEGRRVGFAEAEARRTATAIDDGEASRARAADQIVRQAMDDLNVEFEFQLRRNLRDWLMTGDPAAPLPAPLQQETLSPTGS
ncbi:hypothetical protein [Teichococcus oryzae]|uniref:ABC-type transport auxiliary lipoprotein component domain-containing protein n=1 Tax=Teichococcus oryzae TaxID=1608942 RepID=A0A5B2TJ47_9PROT|nr:hypothetical protein [Pseudoroseomonas oryzae]KAA2214512.1 hypothetical protein F0Q34_01995 [Pseudoroseomonas oryzae]